MEKERSRRSVRSPRLAWRTALPLLFALLASLPLATSCRREPAFQGEELKPAKPAPELAGTNWDGAPYRLSAQRGKVVVIFFGYTFCPDVCPFTLAKMKQLYARLGDQAKDVEVVFVSVDPRRDTVEKLAQYVPSFDRRFFGVRMEQQAVLDTSKEFGATVQYGVPKEGVETDTFYLVDHTASFFVIDRQGRLRLKFAPNAGVEQMAPDLERLAGEGSPEAAATAPQAVPKLEIRTARALLYPSSGALYFTVVNPGTEPDRLLRVETPAASSAETHESVMDGSTMRMVAHPDGFVVPAHGSLELAPGGKHVMLMGLKPTTTPPPTAIHLSLHFERAGTVELQATVESR